MFFFEYFLRAMDEIFDCIEELDRAYPSWVKFWQHLIEHNDNFFRTILLLAMKTSIPARVLSWRLVSKKWNIFIWNNFSWPKSCMKLYRSNRSRSSRIVKAPTSAFFERGGFSQLSFILESERNFVFSISQLIVWKNGWEHDWFTTYCTPFIQRHGCQSLAKALLSIYSLIDHQLLPSFTERITFLKSKTFLVDVNAVLWKRILALGPNATQHAKAILRYAKANDETQYCLLKNVALDMSENRKRKTLDDDDFLTIRKRFEATLINQPTP